MCYLLQEVSLKTIIYMIEIFMSKNYKYMYNVPQTIPTLWNTASYRGPFSLISKMPRSG